MTERPPLPRYGEYAPIDEQQRAAPVEHAAAPAPDPARAEPKRRTGDVVITGFLLVWGVFDVISSWPVIGDLSSILSQLYADQGVGEFTSNVVAVEAGLVANVTRAVILVVTILIALLLIARSRRAFWVPLVGGALASLTIAVTMIVVMLIDPALAAYAGV